MPFGRFLIITVILLGSQALWATGSGNMDADWRARFEREVDFLKDRVKNFYFYIKHRDDTKKERMKGAQQQKLQRQKDAEERERKRKAYIEERKKRKKIDWASMEKQFEAEKEKQRKLKSKQRKDYIVQRNKVSKALSKVERIPERTDVGLEPVEVENKMRQERKKKKKSR